MKKLLTLLFSVLMVVGLAESVLAEQTIPSVTTSGDVKIVGGGVDPDDVMEGTDVIYDGNTISYTAKDGCEVKLVLTPYAQKSTIESDDSKSEIDEAYSNIKNTNDLIVVVSNKTGRATSELVVSNLFDVTFYVNECGTHGAEYDHERIYELEVGCDVVSRFVALAHYNEDGTWTVIDNAKAVGTSITFTYPTASPFAVIVRKDSGSKPIVDTSTRGVSVDYVPYVAGFGLCVCVLSFLLKRKNAR